MTAKAGGKAVADFDDADDEDTNALFLGHANACEAILEAKEAPM